MEETMARKRKQYTGEEKLAILRKHLLEGVAVSDICDEHDLQPAVFYRW
jgi:transposase